RRAQQKAGITKTGAIGEVQRLQILPGIAGLGVGNGKATVGPPCAFLTVSVNDQFPANFKGVIALHPRQINVGRRLFFPKESNESWTHASPIGQPSAGASVPQRAAPEDSADSGETVGFEESGHSELGLVVRRVIGGLVLLNV